MKFLNFIGGNRLLFISFARQNYQAGGRGAVLINFSGDDYDYEYLPRPVIPTGDIDFDHEINKLLDAYDPLTTTVFLICVDGKPVKTLSLTVQ
jgi:hypothetical protein